MDRTICELLPITEAILSLPQLRAFLVFHITISFQSLVIIELFLGIFEALHIEMKVVALRLPVLLLLYLSPL